jgi:hypothetical protein
MPAEFIIPNCKVQSNFTFTMASSGDPSTFTFTMDAFPDYTRFNQKKKVLSVIQVITEANEEKYTRVATDASTSDELKLDKESAAVDANVVAAINAINAIAKASADEKETVVAAARTAFDKLTTAEQILQVYNLEKLLAAEATA